MITYIEDIPRIKPRNLPSSANANAPSGSSRERIVSSGWRTEILQRSSISPCAWIQHTHTHRGTRKGFSARPEEPFFSAARLDSISAGKCSRKKTSENRKTPGGSGKLKLENLEKMEGWESAGKIPREKRQRKPLETGNSN